MKTEMTERNSEETYFAFLDIIRESGQINMFGAAPVLAETYGLTRQESRDILFKWMDTFSSRHPV